MSSTPDNSKRLDPFFNGVLKRACAHLCPPGIPVEGEEEAYQLLEECAKEVGDDVGSVRGAYIEAFKHYLSSDDSNPHLFQPAYP